MEAFTYRHCYHTMLYVHKATIIIQLWVIVKIPCWIYCTTPQCSNQQRCEKNWASPAQTSCLPSFASGAPCSRLTHCCNEGGENAAAVGRDLSAELWSICKLYHIASPGIRLPLLNGYHACSLHWKDTPFPLILGEKSPPILAKTRTFVGRKITLFSDFMESTLRDDPFWNKLRTFVTVVIHFFRMVFLLPSFSCGHIRTLHILKM